LSPHGTGLEGEPTHFAEIYERIFTQKFKLFKKCLKQVYFEKSCKNSVSTRRFRSKPPLVSGSIEDSSPRVFIFIQLTVTTEISLGYNFINKYRLYQPRASAEKFPGRQRKKTEKQQKDRKVAL